MLSEQWNKATKSGAAGHCLEAKYKTASYCGTSTCVEIGFHNAEACNAGSCVEVGFKSANICGHANCVEVGTTRINVLMRDSKQNGMGPILTFTPQQWTEFSAEVLRQATDWTFTEERDGLIHYIVQSLQDPAVRLYFTKDEWEAFIDGLSKGEFDLPTAEKATN